MNRTRVLTALAAVSATSGALVVTAAPASAGASASAPVVINEVYGGGGNTGATYKQDFVELYNRSGNPVSLAGWSVQYASATGTSWATTALTGTLPAGSSYVVRESQGAGGTTDVPSDVTGTIAMSGTAGKVALVNSTSPLSCAADCDGNAAVVDFVGYGATANDFAGTGPTPAPSNTNSVSRNATHDNTANNAADFTAGAPSPTCSCPVATGPVITSADHTTFSVGSAGTFTIATSPAATSISATGALPSGITFNDNSNGTATLAGTPAAGTGGAYGINLQATNADGSGTQTFTLTVNELPSISSANHAEFVVGDAGNFTVTTTAGYPVATTMGETGTLPTGVSFTDNGDGTATLAGAASSGADGTYPLTITATNAAGHTDQSFTLTVDRAQAPPAITSADHTTFPLGNAASFTVTTSPGYPATTALSETGTLPDGVSFNDNSDGTATIAGAATESGSFGFTITASNGVIPDATQTFTLTVTDPPSISSGNSTTFTEGAPGYFTVTTTAGFPTATTLEETGSLPSGVSFTDNGDGTATLSGTPASGTASSYPLTITASNTVGSRQQAFTLDVQPAATAPVITSADHSTFLKGSSSSFTVTTTAGYPTATTLTESGTLPSGVGFTDNGDGSATLAGTPTVAGAFTFTITASNGVTTDATQSHTLTVNASPAITSAGSTTVISDVSGQSFTVTTTAGYPSVTTLSETGALPPGMTFTDNHDGTATIAGTPSVSAGAGYPLLLKASNGAAPDATQSFTLTVAKVAAVALPARQPKSSGKLGGVPAKVFVGQVLTITGGGYKPGAPIELGWYYSSSTGTKLTVLAHTYADAAGAFSVAVPVARNTGSKTMAASGVGADGKARYLTAPTVVNPPSTTGTYIAVR